MNIKVAGGARMNKHRDRERGVSIEGAGIEEHLETGYVSVPLLSMAEAAKYLGVGRKILMQLIEGGADRGGKVRRIDPGGEREPGSISGAGSPHLRQGRAGGPALQPDRSGL
jgi:hypothetical protein